MTSPSNYGKFVAQAKHKMEIERAEDRAEFLEVDASFAIDYAVAAVEQAQLAVLDAVEAPRGRESEAHLIDETAIVSFLR